MLIFIGIYLLVYGGLHYWMTTSLMQAYPFSYTARMALIAFMVLMVALPMLLAILERKHLVFWLTRPVSWLAFTWMGIIFLMLAGFVTFSMLQGGLYLIQPWTGAHGSSWIMTSTLKMNLTLLLVAAGTLMAFYEASQVKVEHLKINTAQQQSLSQTLRLVQISDLHLGTLIREDYLHKIIKQINAQKPDLIVCTGDLVDAPLEAGGALANMFKQLQAPLGKYAIMGNHEYIAGYQSSVDFLKAAGFDLLQGETRTLSNGLVLAGVDDPSGKYFKHFAMPPEKTLLSEDGHHGLRILLKHRPVVDPESLGLFDLQLSGHTHKGQLFPFHLFTKLAFPYHSGLFKLRPQQWLYVSRGTGTWGPPMRLLAPPEITVIDIGADK